MDIEFILVLIALFVAASSFVIAVSLVFRVHRLERDMENLRFSWTRAQYKAKLIDIPAFLRRQAD